MPSIKDAMNTDLSGYSAIITKPPIQQAIPNLARVNSYLRCTLPPFNIDPDTLRQFENGSSTPKIRVMPLPQNATVEGNVTESGTTVSSSSSSGGSSTTGTIPAKSVNLTTSILSFGSSSILSIAVAKSFQLLSVSANAVCEVRLYGSQLAQLHDQPRTNDQPVAPEITSNVIACVTFDTAPYSWPFQNIIAANQNSPQDTTLYVTVFNTSLTTSAAITLTIQYVPLES